MLIETGWAPFAGCAAAGSTRNAPYRIEDGVDPDRWMGDDGSASTAGVAATDTGTVWYCDVWSLCRGDLSRGDVLGFDAMQGR